MMASKMFRLLSDVTSIADAYKKAGKCIEVLEENNTLERANISMNASFIMVMVAADSGTATHDHDKKVLQSMIDKCGALL